MSHVTTLPATESLALALQGSDFGFWDIDVSNDEIVWHGDWYTIIGIDPCLGPRHSPRWAARIHPEDSRPMSRYHDLVAGRIEHYEEEYRVQTRSGDWRWLMTRARATERDANGRALRVAGLTMDIDARKRTELKLRDTEARLEAAVLATQLGVWENPRKGLFRWLNDWCSALDLDPCDGEGYSERWRQLVHPDDIERCIRQWDPQTAGDAGHYVVEYRVRTQHGRWRWIHERGMVSARDETGCATAFVGICMDIDTRKRMELELQTQARILETLREGVVLFDASGHIEFTNPAFDRMLGRDRGELHGLPMLELLNAHFRGKAQRNAIERLIKRSSGRGGNRTVLLRRADRSRFAAEVVAATIDWNGETKILCVVQDISDRKRLEQEITEVAYQERRRLGSDLHDGLGQDLTGIALLLRGIAPLVSAAAAPIAPRVDEIIGLVNHAIESTREMAIGLSPVRLGRGGLVDALGALVERARANFRVSARLRLGLRCPLSIDEASAAHLFLIAQEALINACKHGHARLVTISLRVNRLFFSLSIADDGIGIEPSSSASAGMGLKIMRYRAGAIGGTLQIRRRRPAGTRVRCVCPHTPPSQD